MPLAPGLVRPWRPGRVPPGARVPMVENATPYPFTADELERAVVTLVTWLDDPTW